MASSLLSPAEADSRQLVLEDGDTIEVHLEQIGSSHDRTERLMKVKRDLPMPHGSTC